LFSASQLNNPFRWFIY